MLFSSETHLDRGQRSGDMADRRVGAHRWLVAQLLLSETRRGGRSCWKRPFPPCPGHGLDTLGATSRWRFLPPARPRARRGPSGAVCQGGHSRSLGARVGRNPCRGAGAETTSHFFGRFLCHDSLGQAEEGCACVLRARGRHLCPASFGPGGRCCFLCACLPACLSPSSKRMPPTPAVALMDAATGVNKILQPTGR